MKTLPLVVVFALVLVAGVASAVDFVEDFETEDVQTDPERDWFVYTEGTDIGNVSDIAPVLNGAQSFRVRGDTIPSTSDRYVRFDLDRPTTLEAVEFDVKGVTLEESPFVCGVTSCGTEQVVSIQSLNPVRTMVRFFILCTNTTFTDGCEFRVQFDLADSQGEVLINASPEDSQFNVRVEPDWQNGQYRLFVDAVDDGLFPFLEVPRNIGRIEIAQVRASAPIMSIYDDLTVEGALLVQTGAVEGDLANGIKGFAEDIRLTDTASRFIFGFILFCVLLGAVVVPIIALGLDNSVVPATSFFAVLAALWVIDMGFWPEWVGIAFIILTAAVTTSLIMRLALNIKDASGGGGLIAGSMGYFIVASTLLAFSGYAGSTIQLPSGPAECDTGCAAGTQNFTSAVVECIFTIFQECTQKNTETVWDKITDAAGEIFGWARASVRFIFQLLTFRLPIPIVFSALIVGPPAAALAYTGFAFIRGFSS